MAGYNHFPEIAVALHLELAKVINTTCDALVADAQDRAPVDTSFLKGSIYKVTLDESTYGQGIGPTHSGSYLLPEVEKPNTDLEAYVGVAANYGIYQEMGTRHMPAQPYFYPAIEAAKATFNEQIGLIESSLEGIIR